MALLDKCFDILETVAQVQGEISLADLTRKTGFCKTTVHRLCSGLVKRGYLYQNREGKEYALGFKLLLYNNANRSFSVNLVNQTHSFIQSLCNEIKETVFLSVLEGVEVLDIDTVGPEHILTVANHLLIRIPLHCTASGKVFLAYMSAEKLRHIIDTVNLTANTSQSITNWDDLKKELESVRNNEIAFDNEEFVIGVKSVASPIKDRSGNILAAITVVAPSARVDDSKLSIIAQTVRKTAHDITDALE